MESLKQFKNEVSQAYSILLEDTSLISESSRKKAMEIIKDLGKEAEMTDALEKYNTHNFIKNSAIPELLSLEKKYEGEDLVVNSISKSIDDLNSQMFELKATYLGIIEDIYNKAEESDVDTSGDISYIGGPYQEYIDALNDRAGAGENITMEAEEAEVEQYYIWVKWDGEGEFEPHMSFDKTKEGRAEAKFELEDLRHQGHKAKQGEAFPMNEEAGTEYIVQYDSQRSGEEPFMLGGSKWEFVNGIYPDGKKDIAVYRFDHDMTYDYSWFMNNMVPKPKMNETIEEELNAKDGSVPELDALISRIRDYVGMDADGTDPYESEVDPKALAIAKKQIKLINLAKAKFMKLDNKF